MIATQLQPVRSCIICIIKSNAKALSEVFISLYIAPLRYLCVLSLNLNLCLIFCTVVWTNIPSKYCHILSHMICSVSNINHQLTRQHSSTIYTARLETVHTSVSVANTECNSGGGGGIGPQVTKFEQASRDHHQMSLAGLWSQV